MSFFLSDINPVYVFRRKGTPQDPYVSVTETIKVNDTGSVILKEIPSKFDRVVITNYYEVQKYEGLKDNEFFVDYKVGIVYFTDINIGKNLEFVYMGTGVVSLGSSRVFVEHDGNRPTKSLQKILDESSEILRRDSTAIDDKLAEADLIIAEVDSATQEARTQAGYAKTHGDTAKQATIDANQVVGEARDAVDSIADAVDEANTAVANANTAVTNATKAVDDANTAIDRAETATGDAVDATNTANIKIGEMTTLLSETTIAKNETIIATSDAQQATQATNQAIADANTATQATNQAISDANLAKDKANQSATNADEKAILADAKAQLADEKANLADEKANLADIATAEAIVAKSEIDLILPNVLNMENVSTYSDIIQYKKNNIVEYDGSSYQALKDTVGNKPPNLPLKNNEFWNILAQKGTDGLGSVASVNDKSPNVDGNVQLAPQDIGASPSDHTHDELHIHNNKNILDKFTEDIDGNPQYDGEAIGSVTSVNGQIGDVVGLATVTQLGDKVDKVSGKGLSTEDYTTAEKTKLSGMSTVATSGSYNDLLNKPTLGTVASRNTGTSNGDIPIIGSNGKIDTSVLPALAITDTFVVNTQSSMLALSVQVGDVCVREDLKKTFILRAEPANVLANWQELLSPTDAVQSVNGKTGVVSINKNDVGLSNVDNIQQATKEEFNTHVGNNGIHMTSAEKTKLAGIAENANNYIHPSSHPASIITESTTRRFVTDTQISNWNGKETTVGAQSKADQALADAKSYVDSKGQDLGIFEWVYNASTQTLDLVVIAP